MSEGNISPATLDGSGRLWWGSTAVPWSAGWTGEYEDRDSVCIRTEHLEGKRLRFLCDGVDRPGLGRPRFKTLHNERCRDLIRTRSCQICRRHYPPGAKVICMNQGERDWLYPLINDGLPMCDDCAALALRQCPGLQRAMAAGLLKVYRAWTWAFAPVLIGKADPATGGNPKVNALLDRERGPVFSGIKLLLTGFQAIDPGALLGADGGGW